MSEALGPRNALAAEDDDKAAGTEVNVGYDPLWVPTGLLGKYSSTMGLRGKQNIFQIGDFMALGSSFRHD